MVDGMGGGKEGVRACDLVDGAELVREGSQAGEVPALVWREEEERDMGAFMVSAVVRLSAESPALCGVRPADEDVESASEEWRNEAERRFRATWTQPVTSSGTSQGWALGALISIWVHEPEPVRAGFGIPSMSIWMPRLRPKPRSRSRSRSKSSSDEDDAPTPTNDMAGDARCCAAPGRAAPGGARCCRPSKAQGSLSVAADADGDGDGIVDRDECGRVAKRCGDRLKPKVSPKKPLTGLWANCDSMMLVCLARHELCRRQQGIQPVGSVGEVNVQAAAGVNHRSTPRTSC